MASDATGDVSFDEDLEILREALREQERLLDTQAEGMGELDTKAQNLISIAILAIGAAAAVAIYVTDRVAGKGLLLLIPIAFGVLLNTFALAEFTFCYVGIKGKLERRTSPDPKWIAKKAADPEWTLIEHHLAVIQGAADAFMQNKEAMDVSVTHRSRGVLALWVALMFYALTAFGFVVLLVKAALAG